MKKSLRVFSLVSFLIILSWLGWEIKSKISEKRQVKQRTSRLPTFSLFDVQNGLLVNHSDVREKPLWMVFFHTTCDYCQMEANNIRNSNYIKNLDVWLISSEQPDTLSAFGKRFGLDTLTHVRLLYDPQYETFANFSVVATPASFLYHPAGHLIQSYKGLVRTETVLSDAGFN